MTLPLDEVLLDDADALVAADRGATLLALAGAGAQVRVAVTSAEEAGVRRIAEDGRPRAVVVAALGSSAMVGDLLSAFAGAGSPVPVQAVHARTLPGWVGPVDLVVAVSLSGAADGPLAVAAEAARRGCRLLTVGAAGSPLADVSARARGIHVPVSRDLRSSRSSLWALAIPVLMGADALDLVDVPMAAFEEAAAVLDEIAERSRPSSEAFVNPAKSLALDLAGSIPLVLGEGDLAGVAAMRASYQLARYARHPAVSGVLPDAAAEIVATFDGPFARRADDVFADPFEDGDARTSLRLLLMRDDTSEPSTRMVADVVRDTALAGGVRVNELSSTGEHGLARIAGLVAMTDFAAVYLALGAGLDPVTSPHVADLRDGVRRGLEA
jgi:D-arabinose 5-phosphate isomerase GutQ